MDRDLFAQAIPCCLLLCAQSSSQQQEPGTESRCHHVGSNYLNFNAEHLPPGSLRLNKQSVCSILICFDGLRFRGSDVFETEAVLGQGESDGENREKEYKFPFLVPHARS